MKTAEEICKALNIDHSQILNIYPYGSKIYGTATEDSDDDYVIVYRSSLLPSGAFKDNAISSEDKMIQGTCYSRGGFIDALNNYQITALECLYLPDELVVQKKMKFKMYKFDDKEFIKSIIEQASAAWYRGTQSYKKKNIEFAKKHTFHALRILMFAMQIKKRGAIDNYGRANDIKKEIYDVEDEKYRPRMYLGEFMRLSKHLKY